MENFKDLVDFLEKEEFNLSLNIPARNNYTEIGDFLFDEGFRRGYGEAIRMIIEKIKRNKKL